MRKKRTQISKGLRFSVFDRDGYTCRYCGKGADATELAVDHIIPVCKGGTNAVENLATSCLACNIGKGGKPLGAFVINESEQIRLAERREKELRFAKHAAETIEARLAARQEIVDYVCGLLHQESCMKSTVTCIYNMAQEFGMEQVQEWMYITIERFIAPSESKFIRYICGCRKQYVAKREALALEDPQ
jgi:hypothetical protein